MHHSKKCKYHLLSVEVQEQITKQITQFSKLLFKKEDLAAQTT
jgi:hypothetical protein